MGLVRKNDADDVDRAVNETVAGSCTRALSEPEQGQLGDDLLVDGVLHCGVEGPMQAAVVSDFSAAAAAAASATEAACGNGLSTAAGRGHVGVT